MEDEPLDFVVVSSDKPGEEAAVTPAGEDAPAEQSPWTFGVVDRSSDDGKLITTQQLFGDVAESQPVTQGPPPHRRPFSFLIPGVHLLGKPRTDASTPTPTAAEAEVLEKTDVIEIAAPEPANLQPGGAGWNIRVTPETIITPDTAPNVTAEPDLTPIAESVSQIDLRWAASIPRTYVPSLEPGTPLPSLLGAAPETGNQPDTALNAVPVLEPDLPRATEVVGQINLRWVAAIPRTYVPRLSATTPLPRLRGGRAFALKAGLATAANSFRSLALALVGAGGRGLKTTTRSVAGGIKLQPRSLRFHPLSHLGRRLLIVAGLLVMALIGVASVVGLASAHRAAFKPASGPHHATAAISVLTTNAAPTPSAPAPTPTPTAVPPSAAAPPAPIPIALAPVHHATPAPTAPPAPTPTPTPVPTPTPPVQLNAKATGYLSVTTPAHTCTPSSGFTAASLIGPDGFTRSCTFTFTENVSGTISASLTSTGDPLGSSPVVQAGGYCILLYGATGTTPLAKTCTAANSAGPALFTQKTSTLSQTIGTFRIEVEAMSAKTSFSFSVTHY